MRLIITGCEYSGTTTLSFELAKWGKKQFIESGKEEAGWDLNAFHDHWKIPHVNNFSSPKSLKEQNELIAEYPDASNGDWSRTGLTKEEQEMILGLTPRLKEMFQRYHLEYHIQKAFYEQNHHIMIGAHIEEGIYGPLYFGYGGPGQKGEREKSMRSFEEQILEIAPDTILILVKADPEVIKNRMKVDPHSNGCLKEKDIEHVLKRFDEEYEASLLNNKFTIDTSSSKIGESFEELIQILQPYI